MTNPRIAVSDTGLGVLLVISQVLTLILMVRSSSTDDGDPFDSSLYWWTWLLYPALAAAATRLRPGEHRPIVWTAALMVPLAIEVALLGTVWHDPDDGASLWIAGEIFVAVQAVVTLLAATTTQAVVRLRRRESS